MDKKLLYNVVMSDNVVAKQRVINLPYKKLKTAKEEQNLTISKIAEMTKVSRDVVTRFLDGQKINHIDYIKIYKVFPEVQECGHKENLQVKAITMFGALEPNGYVRGRFLNDPKEFYLPRNLVELYPNEIIGLHDSFSANKFICMHIPKKTKFVRADLNYVFLIKTHTDCLFGIVKETNNDVFDIVCRHTFKELQYKRDDIIEIFEMVTTVSGRWSELKDKKINSIVTK